MNLSLFISRRYLFAKKSQNAINIISVISVFGVAIGTMALIVILSVFNGFDKIIKSLFNSFDPDLKITLVEGKTFTLDDALRDRLKNTKGVLFFSEVIEENALLKYNDKQYIATVKGVSDDYMKMTGIDSMMTDGKFMIKDSTSSYALVGQGVAYFLSLNVKLINPIIIYVPKRNSEVSFNPEESINKKFIFPSGVFSIQQDFDAKYIIVPIDFAQGLFEYTPKEISSLEIKTNPLFDKDQVQKEVQKIAGTKFVVKNRYQQNELFYKIMGTEKWAIFFILSFILLVASFNIIGSLTMLIIDKKNDINTLNSIGADDRLIRRIFITEGWMISVIGAVLGLVLGLLICFLQIKFKLVQLQGGGSFIVDAYPVDMQLMDFVLVFGTVLLIGFAVAYFPVRYITKKYINH
jgi:lipoprotein-releasing system permease protein